MRDRDETRDVGHFVRDETETETETFQTPRPWPRRMVKTIRYHKIGSTELRHCNVMGFYCISDKGLDVQQYTRNRIGPHMNKSALDDICSMWSLIDESVGIMLPTFCAFDLSRIPVLCDEMSDIAVIKKSVMDLESQVKTLSASLSAIRNPRLYDEMFPPMPLSSSSSSSKLCFSSTPQACVHPHSPGECVWL